MSFYGTSMLFDGIPCEEMGLVMYDFTSNRQSATTFSSDLEIAEDRIGGRYRSLFYGGAVNAPLTFTMVLCASEDRAERNEPLDRWDLQKIAAWLTGHREYKWLSIVQEDMEEIRYRCLISSLQAAYARLARGERAALPPEGALLLAEAEVIRELADEGPCVLIGRSAGCILRDRTDVLRAFLYADEEARIRRAVDEYGHDENEAANVLRHFDRRRANFYNVNYNLKWEDKEGYHLCLNTGKLGLDACARILLAAMQA